MLRPPEAKRGTPKPKARCTNGILSMNPSKGNIWGQLERGTVGRSEKGTWGGVEKQARRGSQHSKVDNKRAGCGGKARTLSGIALSRVVRWGHNEGMKASDDLLDSNDIWGAGPGGGYPPVTYERRKWNQ